MGKFEERLVYIPEPGDTGHILEIQSASLAYLVSGLSKAYTEIFDGLDAVVRAANEAAAQKTAKVMCNLTSQNQHPPPKP